MADTGIQPYTNARIDYLATYLQTLLPGLDKQVATTWITAEKGVGGNVLGTTYTGSMGRQALYQYPSQEAGLRAAAGWINTRSIYSGVKSSLGQSAQAQATALAASPWNHSYYTGVFANLSKTGPSNYTAPTGSSSGTIPTPNALNPNQQAVFSGLPFPLSLFGTAPSQTGSQPFDVGATILMVGVIFVGIAFLLLAGLIIRGRK